MAEAGADNEIDIKRDRLVIVASSLGTVFEWYDFFIYGILGALIGKLFFPSDNPTAAMLASLAVFGAGFGVRPLGAIVFGYLGDKIGRKYTFLVTISLMGGATAAIGFLPTFAVGVSALLEPCWRCAVCKVLLWAANMAGPRFTLRNMPRRTSAANIPAGFRLRLRADFCSRSSWC
jgi:MFS family permease